MKFPVDEETLSAWATLLGLTDTHAADTLTEIERTLRRGYTYRPLSLRHLSFEELVADMDVDEFALMYLTTGLRLTGHPDAAESVELRGLAAQLQDRTTD